MGNCFIINSIYNQTEGVYSSLRNTSKTGKEFGLKLTLFLDKAENIGLLNHNSGAHVSDQFSVCAPPQLSVLGAYYLHPPDARVIFLHIELLCNDMCSVTGCCITYWGHKQKECQF